MLPHLLLVAVLVLSVYSQLMMKSRALTHAVASDAPADYLAYLVNMALDLRVLSAAAATIVAGVCWLIAIRRLELGYAFPFMALSFVLVPVASTLFLKEPLPTAQLLGLALVFAGVTVSAVARY